MIDREIEMEGSLARREFFVGEFAPMRSGYAVADGKTKTGAESLGFGGKERLKNMRSDFFWNPLSMIHN